MSRQLSLFDLLEEPPPAASLPVNSMWFRRST